MSKDNNKDNGLINGIVLITIGVIALMVTVFDFTIEWGELAKLWPVFIIIFGLSILPINKIIKSILVVITILSSCILYYNAVNEDASYEEESYYYDSNNKDVNVQEFAEPYRDDIKTAKVEINYGAGSLRLNAPVSELVKASNASNFYVQDFSVRYNGNHADICFGGEDNISVKGKTVDSNRFNIALNDNPIYDFEINVGACGLNFDFSDYKVSDIDINSGACNIELKLGELHDKTKVEIETGVSDLRIGIPSGSGCRVECESVMSSKDFEGFDKKSSNVYETPNYRTADNVVDIHFNGAISDFKVYKY